MKVNNNDIRLPGCIVVGPMKTGTSWIYDYLQERGGVSLAVGVKETFYFDKNYSRGADWYKSHYEIDVDPTVPVVDVSPSYFHSELACKRIANDIDAVRLIIVLRDPVKRAWSHYLHLKRKGYTRSKLVEACEKYPEIIDASRYSKHINVWRMLHSKEQITIMFQEDLKNEPAIFAEQLCSAIGLKYLEVSSGVSTRSNNIGLPRYLWVASLGTFIGNLLRRYRFYGLVNVAKAFGLKKVFYGTGMKRSDIPQPDSEELVWLQNKLKLEIEKYTQNPDVYL